MSCMIVFPVVGPVLSWFVQTGLIQPTFVSFCVCPFVLLTILCVADDGQAFVERGVVAVV